MIVVISILIVLVLLVCAVIGVLSIIVTIDSHRGGPFKTPTDRPPTRVEATARRILGVDVHNEQEGD